MSAQQIITQHLDIWTAAHKTRSGVGRGSSNKLDLYGIKKLRELILELAVRGKLVPQDPNDEPAIELLERIATEKAKLVKGGAIKKEKPLPIVDENEVPFDLPLGWQFIRLADVAYSQAGFAFKSNAFNEIGNGLPLIRIRDVGQEFSGTYFDGEYRKEFVVNNGDYLISMDGNFRVAKWLGDDALLNQRVSRLIFFGGFVAPMFIAESLQARLLDLQGIKAYTTVDHLSGGQISGSIIGLPPLAEQHRIVAKVDELMTFCDQLEKTQSNNIAAHAQLVETLLASLTNSVDHNELQANWQRIAAHFDTLFTTEHSIDQLKQTILQLAVMGKLVPQNPFDEPASELLKKIAAEKAQLIKEGKIKKEKSLPEITDEEKPFVLPSGWEFVRLQEIIKISSGDGLTADKMIDEGIPVFGGNGINGYHNAFNITKPTIVIGRVGYYCGSIHLTPEKAWITDNAFQTFFSEDNIFIMFLYWLLKGTNLKERENATAQPVISGAKVYPLVVGLPPLNEQHRIVAKVDELMALCDILKTNVQNAQTTQLALADALVEESVK